MYSPLHVYSYYSVLTGLNSPKEIVSKAKKIGLSSIAITDINNLSGCIEFYKEAKKQNIKPIIGSLISLDDNSTIILIAKNSRGYTELLKITSQINSTKNLNISLTKLSEFNLSNIICITGHEKSSLYNCIVYNFSIKKAWEELSNIHIKQLSDLFSSNLYIELQFSEVDIFSIEVKSKLIQLAEDLNIKLIFCPRVYYLEKENKELYKILVSEKEKRCINELNKINGLSYKFFDSYRFYLPDDIFSELKEWEKEKYKTAIENTNKIAESIEDYNLTKPPSLPKFPIPNSKNTEEYFRELCKDGWNKIKNNINEKEYSKYLSRMEEEIVAFKEANLFDYFLIIRDIIAFAKSKGYLVGAGRGSCGGCLTAYLLDITQIDSIKYGLLFSRFWNPGRADIKSGKFSYPDIDIDFEKRSREDIIKYITKKYGEKNVGLIATYGTMAGRAALKAVFRAYNDVFFSEQNKITKFIPDKAKVSDKLQELKNKGKSDSLIMWSLRNNSKGLAEWCTINEEDNLSGPLADRFKQAIELEGVLNTRSIHAAGLVIAPSPLENLVPMIFEPKEKRQIIGCQHTDLETVGLIKVDILGISTLDRIKDINLE